jgi:hypothetical protein
MKVLTRMFEYVCGRCGCTYRAAQVASGYGIIGFWDASGRYLAVVDGIGDSLFDRVTAALARHPAAPEISDRRRGRVVQWVVAHLSDLAPSGLPFDPEAKPACPHCGAASPAQWQSVEPPETAESEVLPLARDQWNGLTEAEQEDELTERVNDALTLI